MDLLVHRHQRVLHVTLNRPGKRNALNSQMCEGLVRTIREAQEDANVGSILVSAAGHVFCAGMDLDEAVEMHEDELAGIHEDLFTIGCRSQKPIVMGVSGAALGGGLGLVAQGHAVVAAQGAAFGLPEVRIGLWPFLVYRAVEAAVGARRMLELSLTGRTFHSQEALQWGIVNCVSPAAETAERAYLAARDLAKASPAAIKAGMEYYRASRGKTWSEAGEAAKALRSELMKSADFKEGTAAFKAKREPRWPSMPSSFYDENAI